MCACVRRGGWVDLSNGKIVGPSSERRTAFSSAYFSIQIRTCCPGNEMLVISQTHFERFPISSAYSHDESLGLSSPIYGI